jgi:hypothetical protein
MIPLNVILEISSIRNYLYNLAKSKIKAKFQNISHK